MLNLVQYLLFGRLEDKRVGRYASIGVQSLFKNKQKSAFTLVEGAVPVALPNSQRQAAFTLAEVLITLGIIGVIAAMTVPALITKYQKEVTVNELKKSVSSLEQALTRAQVDYGDMTGWSYIQSGIESSSDLIKIERDKFVEVYIMQYMQIATDCGSDNVNKCSNYMITSLDKTSYKMNITNGRIFITPNGTLYNIASDTIVQKDDKGNSKYVSNGRLLITVDINGKSGPNIYGRDVFVLSVDSSAKKLQMFGTGKSRDDLKDGSEFSCNSRTAKRFYCGALIQQDGWQIKDDYLWR